MADATAPLDKGTLSSNGGPIINVPLAKISSNSELIPLFFDGKYEVDGDYVPFKLGFEGVIFVLEDVDAASKVLRR